MAKISHTTGSVVVKEQADGYHLFSNSGRLTTMSAGSDVVNMPNAFRLKACWNACDEAGITTEALERGLLRELLTGFLKFGFNHEPFGTNKAKELEKRITNIYFGGNYESE